MTSTDIDTIGRNQSPATADRVGQATAVEQARAVAEVAAAVRVAQEVPRNLQNARQQMLDSCGMQFLAERAFFRYNRGGSAVTGETVHLARELARCFGNLQYGLAELRRDDAHGQSEMQAFAWDVQNNTRASTTFIVPHKRDRTGGAVDLTDLRDIYENNANMGARRLREQIFAILPKWFTEEAKERCRKTLQEGGGKPLAVRIDDLIGAMRKLGVTDQQLVDRVGRRADQWTPEDVASLGVVWRSITNGEVTREDEFPQARVTSDEITGAKPKAAEPKAPEPRKQQPAAPPATEETPADEPPPDWDGGEPVEPSIRGRAR
jgi:hypothetical protein